ncbi:DUF2793 domain-containing protein [Jannaschia seohaensis]|uniref:Uncharacterized protein DUF2793 n=1 Tax=Jannaschia seohaensis TaxID=475081 RepID=A0A2Y9A9N2_9RHOB|nr:DUF2793 domain-containing protein [Jannaschia seohaensis]PWJ20765.1 uncharacterized protein DUF2793 [Jannaschia seohaensis]SSA41110.1 Protein of unknown function [Jannaschia seohaensis]
MFCHAFSSAGKRQATSLILCRSSTGTLRRAPPPRQRRLLHRRVGATGNWAGWDLNVALWTDGAWLRLPPQTGWRAWLEDEGLLLVYEGAGWIGTTPAALQNLALLAVGTTADASNPFSAKLNAALWTAKTVAEGGTGDLFYTMNKGAAGDDLGLTLQTGFVTKALVGLFGSDRFRLAVSADGSTFFDGLSVDNATGIVDQPRLPRFKAYTSYEMGNLDRPCYAVEDHDLMALVELVCLARI